MIHHHKPAERRGQKPELIFFKEAVVPIRLIHTASKNHGGQRQQKPGFVRYKLASTRRVALTIISSLLHCGSEHDFSLSPSLTFTHPGVFSLCFQTIVPCWPDLLTATAKHINASGFNILERVPGRCASSLLLSHAACSR
jgi:hypothetical protein